MFRLTRGEWLRLLIAGPIVVAILTAGLGALVATQDYRAQVAGESALTNCQQIELVKTQMRGLIETSMRRLPDLAYYRDKPLELAHAIQDSRKAIARFAPLDCYQLPVVRAAGLRHPH